MLARSLNKQVGRTLALASLLVQFAPGASSAEALRTAREVLALAPEVLAQKPAVRLRGVVTYFKPEAI